MPRRQDNMDHARRVERNVVDLGDEKVAGAQWMWGHVGTPNGGDQSTLNDDTRTPRLSSSSFPDNLAPLLVHVRYGFGRIAAHRSNVAAGEANEVDWSCRCGCYRGIRRRAEKTGTLPQLGVIQAGCASMTFACFSHEQRRSPD